MTNQINELPKGARIYRVGESGVDRPRYVIARSQSEAVRKAVANRFYATVATPSDLLHAMRNGIPVEGDPLPSEPEQESLL
jgi:hypothetical protein